MKNILFVTGSRAEYGIMRGLLNLIDNDDEMNLSIIATGTHLSKRHGYTIVDIESDNYKIVEMIETIVGDKPADITISVGTLMTSLGKHFMNNSYDLVLILGDRQEMLAVASAAVLNGIPICHLHGGELTEGNYDEFIRHAITKMSHLHLTSTEIYRNRVIQLGENPETVFNVGALGVENMVNMERIPLIELKHIANLNYEEDYYVVIYHPVTLSSIKELQDEVDIFFEALKLIGKQYLFVGSNADSFSEYVSYKIQKYIKENPNSTFVTSLDSQRFVSLLSMSKGLIGNSSSGIIEAASLQVPTLNIGDRQKGRIAAKSVVNSANDTREIYSAFCSLETVEDFNNPYYQENTSKKSLEIIKRYLSTKKVLQKEFHDIS